MYSSDDFYYVVFYLSAPHTLCFVSYPIHAAIIILSQYMNRIIIKIGIKLTNTGNKIWLLFSVRCLHAYFICLCIFHCLPFKKYFPISYFYLCVKIYCPCLSFLSILLNLYKQIKILYLLNFNRYFFQFFSKNPPHSPILIFPMLAILTYLNLKQIFIFKYVK